MATSYQKFPSAELMRLAEAPKNLQQETVVVTLDALTPPRKNRTISKKSAIPTEGEIQRKHTPTHLKTHTHAHLGCESWSEHRTWSRTRPPAAAVRYSALMSSRLALIRTFTLAPSRRRSISPELLCSFAELSLTCLISLHLWHTHHHPTDLRIP